MGDYTVLVTPSTRNPSVDSAPAGVSLEPWADHAPTGVEPSEAENGHTRRRFLSWGTRVVVGAGVLLGGTVGFTPTAAQAGDYACKSFNFLTNSCYGPYSEAISSCRCKPGSNGICYCICYAGPGRCNPQFFRAHCLFFSWLCCCST